MECHFGFEDAAGQMMSYAYESMLMEVGLDMVIHSVTIAKSGRAWPQIIGSSNTSGNMQITYR